MEVLLIMENLNLIKKKAVSMKKKTRRSSLRMWCYLKVKASRKTQSKEKKHWT
jgi:hypothetical protein